MKKLILISLLSLSAFANEAPEFKDTFFHRQWGLINSGQSIQRTTGETTRDEIQGITGVDINYLDLKEADLPKDREIIVAVLDSGVDIHHKDLKNRIWSSEECRPSSVREDFVVKCAGFDFLDRKTSVKDDVGHGTHVAGIIAANANDIGIAGVTPKNIKIMPVKILNSKTKDFVYDNKLITDIFADGISFARRHGAHIINLSLGWPKLVQTRKIKKELRLAQEAGILIVAAAGNNNKDIPVFPCTDTGVLCVGALDNTGKITEFTNYGGKIDLLAPGESIISTYPMNKESRTLRITGYEKKRGSSQAAPYIAGIAAVVKLMNPGISLNELKARLFNSARPVKEAEVNGKSAKYGLVDMTKAVTEKPKQFITPDFKNLLALEYNIKTGSFGFNLPIASLLGDATDVTVTLSFDNPKMKLKNNSFSIESIEQDEITNNFVQGEITDFSGDANATLKVTIKSAEGFKKTTSTLISLARKLGTENVITKPVVGVDARLISYFKGSRKISRMKRVEDPYNRAMGPEFQYIHPKKQTEEKTVLSLLTLKNNKYVSRDLEMPKINKLIKIYRVDINQDGSDDYMTYSIGSDQENLIFGYFNSDLEPLFGNKSFWKFPITRFEGLPTEKDQIPFKWVALKTFTFGNILTPAITKRWIMPDIDNSDDILGGFEGSSRHLYYLQPTQEGSEIIVKVRALDSSDLHDEVREAVMANFDEEIEIAPPFFQTKEEADLGVVTSLVSVGREFVRRYFILSFSEAGKYSIMPAPYRKKFLASNNVFPLTDVATGNSTSESLFMARFDKKRARMSSLDPITGSQLNVEFQSSSWSDPVFTFIGGFKKATGEKSLFVESRYHVWSMNEDGTKSKLPINRDSAFPGVQFAETMQPIVLKGADQEKQAGIYINSTLIFGDRLYTMTKDGNNLIRPAALSVNIPKTCVQLDPSRLNNQVVSSYTLLCIAPGNKAMIKFFPLSL
jgi:cell wall-associated protease